MLSLYAANCWTQSDDPVAPATVCSECNTITDAVFGTLHNNKALCRECMLATSMNDTNSITNHMPTNTPVGSGIILVLEPESAQTTPRIVLHTQNGQSTDFGNVGQSRHWSVASLHFQRLTGISIIPEKVICDTVQVSASHSIHVVGIRPTTLGRLPVAHQIAEVTSELSFRLSDGTDFTVTDEFIQLCSKYGLPSTTKRKRDDCGDQSISSKRIRWYDVSDLDSLSWDQVCDTVDLSIGSDNDY